MKPSLSTFLSECNDTIKVELTRVRGSSPREEGAFMLISDASTWGTIGGGQLEYMAIDQARALLKSGDANGFMDVPLGPEIGQCCGGRVEASLTLMDDQSKDTLCMAWKRTKDAYRHVYILGAGHVGRALADFFEKLPVRAIIVDGRSTELGMCHATIERRQSALPEMDVRDAPAGSAFIIATHDHALDFLLTYEALARRDAAYVGMIGSATKRTSLERWCKSTDDDVSTTPLICPIGALGSSDKQPEVIAACVVAEVMVSLTAENKGVVVKDQALLRFVE